jgi:hypothetical protein
MVLVPDIFLDLTVVPDAGAKEKRFNAFAIVPPDMQSKIDCVY